MSKELEEDKKLVNTRADKEKALDTAMKLGSQCSRTIENIIESSKELFKFLNENKQDEN